MVEVNLCCFHTGKAVITGAKCAVQIDDVVYPKLIKIIDKRIEFYSQNTNHLLPKPKSSFRHLKQGIQEFHR